MKQLIVSLCVSLVCFSTSAQKKSNTLEDLTWFGIDFSQAKMVGSAGFTDPVKIQSHYLNEWNSVVVTETDKYNISKFYKAAKVTVELDQVKKQNSKVDADKLVTDNSYSVSEEDAKKVVKNYKGKGSGTGLLYVVEYFSKSEEKASIYVIMFNIESGEVSSIKKVLGEAGGFGFRNYWLGAILEVMKKK